MAHHLAASAANALFHIRSLKETVRSRKSDFAGLVKSGLEYADMDLEASLRSLGFDPGRTALEADALFLRLLDLERDGKLPVDAKVVEIERPVTVEKKVDRIQAILEKVASDVGAVSVLYELGRFQQFCFWAVHEAPEKVGWPADLPGTKLYRSVYPWIRRRCTDGVPFEDLGALAALYFEWSREEGIAFLRGLGMESAAVEREKSTLPREE